MTTTFVKTIAQLERQRNSVNGGPRWRVGFADGTSALTKADAQISFAINNPEFQGVPVEFTFDSHGEIVGAKVVQA